MSRPSLVDAIDSLLPQTQCGLCGHAGCRPYAEAIAAGAAQINQCPPGGSEVIEELATLLGTATLPLNTAHGMTTDPVIAVIDEAACIGCTLCIAACPVDAIVGARQLMHTVIAAECTGCALCQPPCPVDCIVMLPTGVPRDRAVQKTDARRWHQRYIARQQRLAKQGEKRRGKTSDAAPARTAAHKRATLDRAMARARDRLSKSAR